MFRHTSNYYTLAWKVRTVYDYIRGAKLENNINFCKLALVFKTSANFHFVTFKFEARLLFIFEEQFILNVVVSLKEFFHGGAWTS